MNQFKLMSLYVVLFAASVNANADAKTFTSKEAAKLANTGDTQGSAEYYAKIGELLLRDNSIYFAHQMFEQALSQDANNIRANFYSAWTNIAVRLQGIRTRSLGYNDQVSRAPTMPWAYQPGLAYESFDFLRDAGRGVSVGQSTDQKKSGWDEFFDEIVAGQSQVSTNEDARQLFLQQGIPAIKLAKEKLAKIRDADLSIVEFKVDGDAIVGRVPTTHHYQSCYYSNQNGYQCYDYEYSDRIGISKFTITQAMVDSMIWHLELYLGLTEVSTAYQLTGYETMHRVVLKRVASGNVSGEKLYALWMKLFETQPRFLVRDVAVNTLNIPARVKSLIKIAFDLDINSDLCEKSAGNSVALLHCEISRDLLNTRKAELLFTGAVQVLLGYSKQYQPVFIQVNVPALLNSNGPADLKALFPAKMDLERAPDQTFSGLFPDADLGKKLKSVTYSIDPIIQD